MHYSFSSSVTKWLVQKGAISINEEPIFRFAIKSTTYSIIPLLIFFIACLLNDMLLEGLTMILPFVCIRKYSGGFHFNRRGICLVASTILLILSVVVFNAILFSNKFTFCSILTCMSALQLVRFSPIESDKRALSKKEKYVFRLITTLFTFAFLSIYYVLFHFKMLNYAVSISIGISIPAILQLPCIIINNLSSRNK